MLFLIFDISICLSHSVLLLKLRALGISNQVVCWIESFLIGRSMSVQVQSELSDSATVSSGVHQGSVLGPILFLIYINSIADANNSHWKAFADDYKLYIGYPRKRGMPAAGSLSLQEDLNKVCMVGESWNLELNPSKCVVMRFSGPGVVGSDSSQY